MKDLRMGTRGSKLALVQSRWVQQALVKAHQGLRVPVQVIRTTGDKNLDVPFASIGSKGIFTKELDEALLEKRIDFATHSLKDISSELPKGLKVATITECLDARDALVSRDGLALSRLPEGSRVGTSSLRRKALLRRARPDLSILELRGNVDTRLKRLDEGAYDAIVLASAGLKRLGLGSRITEFLDPYLFVPSIGQGTLGIVCRSKDQETQRLLGVLDDPKNHRLAEAQRSFMAVMEGGCQVPLGCYGEEKGEELHLIGFLAKPDGGEEIREEIRGEVAHATRLAETLAQTMLKKGGDQILRKIRKGSPS